MTVARDVMSPGAVCVQSDETAGDAARLMAQHGLGALPICGKDNKLKGVVTDRDLVTKVLAAGRDPGGMAAGSLNQAEAVTIGADDDAGEVLDTMTEHKVRRLPVIDGDALVGMIALADIARTLPESQTGRLVEAVSSD